VDTVADTLPIADLFAAADDTMFRSNHITSHRITKDISYSGVQHTLE